MNIKLCEVVTLSACNEDHSCGEFMTMRAFRYLQKGDDQKI
jgi:hypothetical protein